MAGDIRDAIAMERRRCLDIVQWYRERGECYLLDIIALISSGQTVVEIEKGRDQGHGRAAIVKQELEEKS